MASVNTAMIIGRLGRTPELRYTQTGKPVCNFSVATDESYKGQDGNKVEKTQWHNIVVWGNQAEPCANYLDKGSLVYVEGGMETRKWQDKDGGDRYTTEIKARRVQFLDSKGTEKSGYDGQRNQGEQAHGMQAQNNSQGPAFPSESQNMDSVPF